MGKTQPNHMDQIFKFALGADLVIWMGEKHGEVVGRAEHRGSENQYLVRYVAGTGETVERWWGESALSLWEEPAV